MSENKKISSFNAYWKMHIRDNIRNDLDEADLDEVVERITFDEHLWGFINDSIEDIIKNVENDN